MPVKKNFRVNREWCNEKIVVVGGNYEIGLFFRVKKFNFYKYVQGD